MFDTEVPFDQMIGQVVGLRDAGIQTAWASQIFGYDALTALAVIGHEVPDIDLGTAVVPSYPRHPVMLAGQALTVQAAAGARLTLGIGLSHQVVIENFKKGKEIVPPTKTVAAVKVQDKALRATPTAAAMPTSFKSVTNAGGVPTCRTVGS